MKKIYLFFAFLFISGFAIGQTLQIGQTIDNPRAGKTKINVSELITNDFVKMPHSINAKGSDTLGWEFFNLLFDANEYYAGPNMGREVIIQGDNYGHVNRIFQEYWFSEIEFGPPGNYNIKEVITFYAWKDKNDAAPAPSEQRVYLFQINADSSYTVQDSAAFTIDDVDTTAYFTVIPFANQDYNAESSSAGVIGVSVGFYDYNSTFRLNQDTAMHTTALIPAAPEYSAFWATDDGQNYIFFYDPHQMITIFLVADNLAGIVGGEQFIEGMQLSQNYPNPAPDGVTTISYAISQEMDMSLQVIDNTGRLVEIIDIGVQQAGTYEINLSTKLAKGIYYYSLIGNGRFLTKKMIVN